MTRNGPDNQLPVIARFEVRYRNYLAPDGAIIRPLPAFAANVDRLVSLYRAMVLVRAFDLYDPLQRNEVFRDSPVLPIAGERHRYVPIDENAYKEIRQQVERGDYHYNIEEGEYSLDDYLARLDAVQVEVA